MYHSLFEVNCMCSTYDWLKLCITFIWGSICDKQSIWIINSWLKNKWQKLLTTIRAWYITNWVGIVDKLKLIRKKFNMACDKFCYATVWNWYVELEKTCDNRAWKDMLMEEIFPPCSHAINPRKTTLIKRRKRRTGEIGALQRHIKPNVPFSANVLERRGIQLLQLLAVR